MNFLASCVTPRKYCNKCLLGLKLRVTTQKKTCVVKQVKWNVLRKISSQIMINRVKGLIVWIWRCHHPWIYFLWRKTEVKPTRVRHWRPSHTISGMSAYHSLGTTGISEYDSTIQEHLIDIQSGDETHSIFHTHRWSKFWIKSRQSFPPLWQKVKLLLLAFPTTYFSEQGFCQARALREILPEATKIDTGAPSFWALVEMCIASLYGNQNIDETPTTLRFIFKCSYQRRSCRKRPSIFRLDYRT